MAKQKTLEEKFPIEGTFTEGEQQQTNPDNYFKNHSLELVRKKYIQQTVYMEALNQVLELNMDATADTFMMRVRDLIIASSRET